MELTEVEMLVGEAETRVERLRALYDMYFMGIEKIEPQTARKDVERRIQVLRRTQIRNTALRFRFQNVLLRYNTFSAHWMRICRQIEDGTYKHHLRKAKARFDSPAAARDARLRGTLAEGDTEPPGPTAFELDEDLDVDVDFDEGVDAPGVRAALRTYAVPQDVVAPSVAGRAVASMASTTPRAGVRDASLDKTTDPAPPPVPSLAPPTSPTTRAAPPLPTRAAAPPLPGRAAPPLPAGAKPPPPPPAKPAPPLPNRPPLPGAAASAKPAVPVVGAKPVAPVSGVTPPGAAATRPAPPLAGARPGGATPPATAARPAAAAAQPKTAARPAAAATTASVADERTRETYSKYVETRKKLGESTAAITMDSFARSLRDSSEKLRQKHPGKTVDFDVQVKDGKTVLKPIVR